MNRSITTAIIGLIALTMVLLACDGKRTEPKPQPPQDTTSTKPQLPDPVDASPVAAATKGLAIFKDMSQHPETYALAGFGSIEEVEKATLGATFTTYALGCDAGTQKGLTKPLTDHVMRSQATFPVLVGNRLRSVIYVDAFPGKEKTAAPSQPDAKDWQVTGMGDAQLATVFDSASAMMPKEPTTREKDILVKLPQAYMAFRATGLGEKDQAIALGAPGKTPCFERQRGALPWPAIRKQLSNCKAFMEACKDSAATPAIKSAP